MRVGALYIRVSTDDQVEYSPDAQIRLGLEYAEKNNILVPKEYIFQDDGISGRKAKNRPAFQQMIAMANSAEHPIDVIIVWKFSRFARNQEEAIVYKNLLRKSNIEVVSVSEPIPEGFIGELVQRIFEWMDEYYSINLGVEAKRGMTQKVMNGGYVSKAPYGYTHVKGGVPVINQRQAAVVRSIAHKFHDEGLGTSSIARQLNDSGIKTGTGNTWCPKTVKYILQNPFYIGVIRWDYQPTDVTGRHINENCMLVKGSHEPILEAELFNSIQERLKLCSSGSGKKRIYTEEHKHWLSCVVKCASCGGSLGYGSKGQGRKPTFRCVNYSKGRCDCSNGIVAHRLEKAVIEGLSNAVATHSYHVVKPEQDTSEIDAVKDALQMLPMKEERIRLAYMDGIDTVEDYKKNKELLQKEQDSLKRKFLELQKDVPTKNIDLNKEILSAVDLLADEKIPNTKKSLAIRSICQKIVYDKKTDTLDFYLVCE